MKHINFDMSKKYEHTVKWIPVSNRTKWDQLLQQYVMVQCWTDSPTRPQDLLSNLSNKFTPGVGWLQGTNSFLRFRSNSWPMPGYSLINWGWFTDKDTGTHAWVNVTATWIPSTTITNTSTTGSYWWKIVDVVRSSTAYGCLSLG